MLKSSFFRKLQQLAKRRFDLAHDWPFEVQLLKLSNERHVLVAVVHHVAFDGWSGGIFLSEFQSHYEAAVSGRRQELPPLAIQYADFAIWQREQEWDKDLAYWVEELDDAPARIELPGREPEAGASRQASTIAVDVGRDLHARLLKLARDSDASLFMVLHAAFALLLSRWSSQGTNVVVGTVVANRTSAELEPLMGCFVKHAPAAYEVDGRGVVPATAGAGQEF